MSVTLHKDTTSGDPTQTDGKSGAMDVNARQVKYTTTTTTTVTVDTTGTVLVAANSDRKYLHVSLQCGLDDDCVTIRYYPAADDDLFHGHILQRESQGAKNVFNLTHTMSQYNIYTGEVSAVSDAGIVDVYVVEGF